MGEYGYYETDQVYAVKLPYRGERQCAYLVAAQDTAGLPGVLDSLDEAAWAKLRGGFVPRHGYLPRIYLVVPRFKIQRLSYLQPMLTALGMGIAFDAARADLGGLLARGASMGVPLGQAAQKAVVDFNEEGTEAAAVTMLTLSGGVTPVVRFDRPFLFMIVDEASGAVLFSGVVAEPPEGHFLDDAEAAVAEQYFGSAGPRWLLLSEKNW
jgi:serpin B